MGEGLCAVKPSLAPARPLTSSRSWVKFCGDQSETNVAVACIGHVSARAAEKLGLGRIYFPEKPGE